MYRKDFAQITEHFESRTEEIQDVITPIEISKLECEPTNQDPEVSDLNDDPCNNQPSESEAEDQISKQEEPPQTILSIPDGNEYLFGARILAYVDGVGSGTLGAWAFVLIDRQTGWALLRAKGVSSTTSSRMRLQACIEALSCLKQQSQTIEIRSRYRNLIQMGSTWIDNWKKNDWKNSKKEIN